MKKATLCLMYLLVALTILLPVGTLVSACFGYTFELVNVSAFAVVIAVLSVCAVVLSLVSKSDIENKPICILLAVLAPLSLINALLFVLECSNIWVFVSVFTSAGCCFCLAIEYGRPLALKIMALVLSVLMVLPIGFLSFIVLIFGDFVQKTVVQTIESPSGKCYIQVIDCDQGALGSDTLVDVYERKGINALVFKIAKKPQRVYYGKWGEFKNMRVYWKDDDCFVINSIEYKVK